MRLLRPSAIFCLCSFNALVSVVVLTTGLHGSLLRAESCAENLSPQTVILDEFEARDAAVSDVLEALTLTVERITNRTYQPNFIIVGSSIGRMKITLALKSVPLSDALDRIGSLPGVQVTYGSNQTVVFSAKEG